MFSLIITIISIALVAALALATLYYGGTTFNKGSASAQASQLLNEGQQLLGASEVFYANENRWPESVQELVSLKYLSFSFASARVVANALAANSWSMVAPGNPVFITAAPRLDVCLAFNKNSYGLDGVLAKAHTQVVSQCFGDPAGEIRVLVGRSREMLLAAVSVPDSQVSAQQVSDDVMPLADQASAWAQPPSPGPSFNLSETTLAFSPLSMGSSAEKTMTLTNTGALALSTPSISATGAGYSSESNCPATLEAGASCNITATFAPAGPQSTAGSLTVRYRGLSPQSTTLTGLGLANYAANVSSYSNLQVVSCKHSVWSAGLGTWYGVSSNGCVGAPVGTLGVGKTITISGTSPVLAKMRKLHDDIASNLRVNGALVSFTGGGFTTVSESPVFTLYPGVNSVSIDVTNNGGPGGWILQLVNPAGDTVISDATGWKYN
jgi:hypothetical protein